MINVDYNILKVKEGVKSTSTLKVALDRVITFVLSLKSDRINFNTLKTIFERLFIGVDNTTNTVDNMNITVDNG